ncbi:triosephosphate isomerase, chloroplastic-like [Spinacia oleracea]|uniref:Triosephosphate isomerase, chloroplastic-like n=1 Tax=Spinacia oleracea TaxID=3562 RepID=A0ABM3QYY1_SPIOL|nr:triosephosphate isomerase, chloroplastic-like [Spinacia oleracea]
MQGASQHLKHNQRTNTFREKRAVLGASCRESTIFRASTSVKTDMLTLRGLVVRVCYQLAAIIPYRHLLKAGREAARDQSRVNGSLSIGFSNATSFLSSSPKKKRRIPLSSIRKPRNLPENGTTEEVKKLVTTLNEAEVPSEEDLEVVVSPPFVFLSLVKILLRPDFHVAAQNCWVRKGGAFTGEVSAEMLVNLDINWVILGHSERRALLNETNDFVADKA